MIYLERTSYYAKPGRARDVLEVRRRASLVRQRLGLEVGRISLRAPGSDAGPDVQWECGFASLTAHDADLQARADSPEFEAVRAEMRRLVERFERHLIQWDDRPGGEPRIAEVALEGHPIVPREVTFETGRGRLAGFLFLPPGEGPFPGMVANHGSGVHQGTTDRCRPSVAAWLLSLGIACFLPHRWGYGDSPGIPWRQEVTAEPGTGAYDLQLAGRLSREADDVAAALGFLQGVPEIVGDRVGVMGSSFGGTVSLLAASRCAGFRCAVNFAGAAMNWDRAPVLRQTMIDAALALTQPIFLIQAANDYSTAPTLELAASLGKAGKPHQAKVFPGFGASHDEGHFFERLGPQVWGPDIRGFLERYL